MHPFKNAILPLFLLLLCTAVARADFVEFSSSTSETLGDLGTKFVIGCAFLAAGMVGAAFVLRKK
ncbi:MAG: hypothetical protein H7A49_05020 [Akkermansiaceae bacterium]|nr:hypothetical protein [Akkermansiaceae bacterium]MCP5543250.1 hypothetical protein [Akkermansiaceae bacterium]